MFSADRACSRRMPAARMAATSTRGSDMGCLPSSAAVAADALKTAPDVGQLVAREQAHDAGTLDGPDVAGGEGVLHAVRRDAGLAGQVAQRQQWLLFGQRFGR